MIEVKGYVVLGKQELTDEYVEVSGTAQEPVSLDDAQRAHDSAVGNYAIVRIMAVLQNGTLQSMATSR